jgi:Bacterial self-protective colicin-like immunity
MNLDSYPEIKDILPIIDSYLERRIDVSEFSSEFLRIYMDDDYSGITPPEMFPPELYDEMQRIFGALEEFCDDPELTSLDEREASENDVRETATSVRSFLTQYFQ